MRYLLNSIRKKKIIYLTAILILCITLVWYLLLRPYDYSASITTKTFPGAINQTLKLWLQNNNNNIGIQQSDLLNVENRFQFNDTIHAYKWEFVPLTDSTTRINVFIKDLDHSLWNRLSAPFSDTDFKKRSKKTILEFNDILTGHIGKFRITVVDSVQTLPETYCAYIPFKSLQTQKTIRMMQNYSILNTVLVDHGIALNGSPFIEVTNWNKETDSISYNFCYPIIKSDSLPVTADIEYKEFKGVKGLKAVYNGNYSTSDRAWYVLLQYARKNNIGIIEKPVEVYFTNPNIGGYEMDWVTEIYMPLRP